MTLTVPEKTRALLAEVDALLRPTSDIEISELLFVVLRDESLTPPERKGAWAEATAFNFLTESKHEGPWGTFYQPMCTSTQSDGTEAYVPDLTEIDLEVITLWEDRSNETRHPVLRARYSDLVWDLCQKAIGKRPDIIYARRAIEAYLDAIGGRLFSHSIHAVEASRRMLELALRIKDGSLIIKCKESIFKLFRENAKSHHVGVWAPLFDLMGSSKNVSLKEEERDELIQTLERILGECSTFGNDTFDPWSAKAAAVRLADHYQRIHNTEQARRAVRTWGLAFERQAQQAEPFLAMTWLQEVHDEYHQRGMNDDATRVQISIAENGKNASDGMATGRVAIELPREQMEQFLDSMAEGSARDALLRITSYFIPCIEEVRSLQQKLTKDAPFFSLFPVIRLEDDHFGASTGSIEGDPDGRLMIQLAQHIEIKNFFLHECLRHLRIRQEITLDTIMSLLDESPVFLSDRRLLLSEGIQAYLDGDRTKAIHVIIPQIEQALRTLLGLLGGSRRRPARNAGTLQVKTLNEILREPAVKACLGENMSLYLLSFLADPRGQNLRNNVCHGLAPDHQFNQRLSDQTLHALLAVSLIRQTPPAGTTSTVSCTGC